jgi:probable HAF family extracellular repeat protein
MIRTFVCRTLLTSAFFFLAASSPAQRYEVTDLGAQRGASAQAHGMNRAGHVVGGSGHPHDADTHAVLWGESAAMHDLGSLPGGDYVAAFAVNDGDAIVGVANTPGGMRAFHWSRATGLQDLGVLKGTSSSAAYAINNLGQIAGASGARAVIWSRAGGAIQDLGTLGGEWSEARSINNQAQVAGTSDTANGPRAFLWTKGLMKDLGVLPGDTESRANQVNDRGAVVGASEGPGGIHAFLWTNEGGMKSLASPSGNYSEAFALNNLGQIVGQSDGPLGAHAYLWNNGGGAIDLNEVVDRAKSGVILTSALSINDKGQIVAIGVVDDKSSRHEQLVEDAHIHSSGTHVFLLTPN